MDVASFLGRLLGRLQKDQQRTISRDGHHIISLIFMCVTLVYSCLVCHLRCPMDIGDTRSFRCPTVGPSTGLKHGGVDA